MVPSEKLLGSFVLVLCLPSIMATTALLFLVRSDGAARASGPLLNLIDSSVLWLFMSAAYGPLLLAIAVPVVLKLGKVPDRNSVRLLAVWGFVCLAVVAAAVFYVVVEPKLELP